jgi:hypothetical protein
MQFTHCFPSLVVNRLQFSILVVSGGEQLLLTISQIIEAIWFLTSLIW